MVGGVEDSAAGVGVTDGDGDVALGSVVAAVAEPIAVAGAVGVVSVHPTAISPAKTVAASRDLEMLMA